MKEIVKKIKIYEFNELSEKIQEELIEKEIIETTEEYCEWYLYDDLYQKATELLRKYFKDNAKLDTVYYDFNYSQGSGAMIQFELYHYKEHLVVANHGHYMHERSFYIEGNITEERHNKLYEKIVNMNTEFTKYGYDLVENCTTRQDAINNLSNLWFLENGEIYIN